MITEVSFNYYIIYIINSYKFYKVLFFYIDNKIKYIKNLKYKLNISTTKNKNKYFAFTEIKTFFNSFFKSEHALQQSYHGLIKENETFVEITPLIKVDQSKVCGFQILKRQREIPFQIELQNGVGVLKAKRQLNCEKRKNYKFDIVAVFCDGAHSKR